MLKSPYTLLMPPLTKYGLLRLFLSVFVVLSLLLIMIQGAIPAYQKYCSTQRLKHLLAEENQALLRRLSERSGYREQIHTLQQHLATLWSVQDIGVFLSQTLEHDDLSLLQLRFADATEREQMLLVSGRPDDFLHWFFTIWIQWRQVTLVSLDSTCRSVDLCRYQLEFTCSKS